MTITAIDDHPETLEVVEVLKDIEPEIKAMEPLLFIMVKGGMIFMVHRKEGKLFVANSIGHNSKYKSFVREYVREPYVDSVSPARIKYLIGAEEDDIVAVEWLLHQERLYLTIRLNEEWKITMGVGISNRTSVGAKYIRLRKRNNGAYKIEPIHTEIGEILEAKTFGLDRKLDYAIDDIISPQNKLFLHTLQGEVHEIQSGRLPDDKASTS